MTQLLGIWAWIKNNLLISVGVGIVILLLFFPRVLKSFFGPARRRRRVRTLPRSVGVRRRYHKGGTAKKPWQIKGSRAAKARMAKIRRKR